jgi:hypothetical protein
MRKLILMLVIMVSMVNTSFAPERDFEDHRGWLILSNGNYTGTAVDVYYNGSGRWEYIMTMHLPGSYARTVSMGPNDEYWNYAWTKKGSTSLNIIYDEETIVY